MPLSHEPQLVLSNDVDRLVGLLQEADEDALRVRRFIEDPLHSAYRVEAAETVLGAVLMRWQADESEIVYIAVEPAYRGRGFGKAIMRRILEEARMRGVAAVVVGTSNASLDQIAFYQKCGFRIDSVRKDYFDYFKEPVYENGIRIQDMLMLRCMLNG